MNVTADGGASLLKYMQKHTDAIRAVMFGYMPLIYRDTALSNSTEQKQMLSPDGVRRFSSLSNLQNRERERLKEQSNSTHTERLTLRISRDLFDRVKAKAKEHELSVSAFVRMILKRETK